MLDTNGPEIRTSKLKDGLPVKLRAGQEIVIEALGDKYATFEGGTNQIETRIGVSYKNLC